MQTTRDFIEAIRAKHGGCSYYQVTRILDVNPSAITRWKKGHGGFDRAVALRVADELALPHAYVIACIEAERETNSDVRGVWESIAAAFQGSKAASILLLVALTFSGAEVARAAGNSGVLAPGGMVPALPATVYYVKPRIWFLLVRGYARRPTDSPARSSCPAHAPRS